MSRIVGSAAGEGAAYRVDLGLRPHGRDGALAVSLAEALRYYHGTAQDWELQVLIRSRAAAGSAQLFARFTMRARVASIARMRRSRARSRTFDSQSRRLIAITAPRARGFNVKLGRGGIREIEFIAQALQLAHGGRDAWLHAAAHAHLLWAASPTADC